MICTVCKAKISWPLLNLGLLGDLVTEIVMFADVRWMSQCSGLEPQVPCRVHIDC